MDKPDPRVVLGNLFAIFFFLLVIPIALARQKQGELGPISSSSFSIVLSISPTVRYFQPMIEEGVVEQESICFVIHGLTVIAKTESDYCPHANFIAESGVDRCINRNHSNVEHVDSIIIEPM